MGYSERLRCTYLYIDKSMQDHGLFQAICRTNRLDGDDKPVGCIVDYKDLFTKVQGAISVYTKELDDACPEGTDATDSEVLMQNRLEKGREKLEAAREALVLLCEPVPPPKAELDYMHYFCGNSEILEELAHHEPQRVALYVAVAGLLRAYAAIADDLVAAGYSSNEIAAIQREKEHAVVLRQIIRQASGETIDLKAYEADMRYLIDSYITAEGARRISNFGELGLVDLIVHGGIANAIGGLPSGIRNNPQAVAETIANNVRSKIISERANDPTFYDRMSTLLTDVLADLHAKRIEYEEYLRRVADIASQVHAGKADNTPEPLQRSPGLRAIYNALVAGLPQQRQAAEVGLGEDPMLATAQHIDERLRMHAPNGFRGNLAKERVVKGLIHEMVRDEEVVERLFPIVVKQAEY